MSILTHYVIALLATSATVFFVGLLVYLKNRRGRVNQAFTIFVLNVAIWSFGEARLIVAQDKASAVFLARLLHSGIILIPTCFLHFIFELLEIKGKRRVILKAAYVYSFIFLVFNNFTGLLLPGATHKFSFNYYWDTGILYPYYIAVWFGIVIYGHYELGRAYLSSTGAKRNQLKYVFWAPLIGYAGGISNYLPAFNIELYPYNPFGTYGVPIFASLIGYAIVRYRLMDISIVIGKLATYSLLLLIISGVYLGLMFGVDSVFFKFSGYTSHATHFLIFLLLSVALIYLIPRIKGEAGEGIEKFFFKNKFNHRESLREFGKRLVLISGEEELLREAANNVALIMGVAGTAIMLRDELSDNYVVRASYGLDEKAKKTVFTPQSGIIDWLTKNKKVFLVEEAEKILSGEELERIKIESRQVEAVVYLPLLIHNELGGALALGEKSSRGMFSHIDIELLEDFTSQLALSISYKRLEAGMTRADRLVSLGTLAAGIAHEIRNPLSSIQIFAQLLPGKYDDKEFREEFSKVVFSDTQRINRIIESVMSLVNPRPSTLEVCGMNELLDETLFLIESRVKKDCVEVQRNYDKQLPAIRADKKELQQVFLNILLNALAALPRGSGRLTIFTRRKSITPFIYGQKGEYVQIEIKDNGSGIEKKLLERIFEPFFTTRPDGTGLGLAVAHRIIEQHGGFIRVESEAGKGTVFFINLPAEVK